VQLYQEPAATMTVVDRPFEPVVVSRWWRDRAGTAFCVRFVCWQGRSCLDVGTWNTARDGTLRRGKDGFTCDVKHGAAFARAFRAALVKAEDLGLASEERRARIGGG
jgi:hypothetical protein